MPRYVDGWHNYVEAMELQKACYMRISGMPPKWNLQKVDFSKSIWTPQPEEIERRETEWWSEMKKWTSWQQHVEVSWQIGR